MSAAPRPCEATRLPFHDTRRQLRVHSVSLLPPCAARHPACEGHSTNTSRTSPTGRRREVSYSTERELQWADLAFYFHTEISFNSFNFRRRVIFVFYSSTFVIYSLLSKGIFRPKKMYTYCQLAKLRLDDCLLATPTACHREPAELTPSSPRPEQRVDLGHVNVKEPVIWLTALDSHGERRCTACSQAQWGGKLEGSTAVWLLSSGDALPRTQGDMRKPGVQPLGRGGVGISSLCLQTPSIAVFLQFGTFAVAPAFSTSGTIFMKW